MCHYFAIFLYNRRRTSQWHLYHHYCDCTPIIDYQKRENEKESQLTCKSSNQWTYNRVFRVTYDHIYKCTCFLCSQCTFDCRNKNHAQISHRPRVNTMALTTSPDESYCQKVSSSGIYTRWLNVHSLHPGQAQTKVQQCASQAHYEALWTCIFGCVCSLLHTDLRRQSIFI